jgi:ribonuclease HI
VPTPIRWSAPSLKLFDPLNGPSPCLLCWPFQVLDPSVFVACFDGASKFNGQERPSIAGAGAVIACPSGNLHTHGAFLGDVSNNVAEFTALVAACQALADLRADHAVLVGDSKLVISALNGACTIHHPDLLRLLWTARCWLASVGSWTAHHVPRAFNSDADRVANDAALSGCSSIALRQPLQWAVPAQAPGMVRCAGYGDAALFPPSLSSAPDVPSVLAGLVSPSASDLWFRDVELFRAGNLHLFPDRWAQVISSTPNGTRVGRWASEGVCVSDFFRHFKGKFMGKSYDSPTPPRASFRNHQLPPALEAFVDKKIAEEVRAGAARVWGAVGEVEPPHLVLPIGVEPSKPRKLHDARYLNLWCEDVPFKFEGLHLVPDLADAGELAFNVDHSSGYWHVALTQDSWTYFGFEWKGVYYTYTVLSFGWNIAPMIYNSFSGEMVGFTRRLRMRSLYLLDDSLGLALSKSQRLASQNPTASAHAAVYVYVGIMIGLGYFVHPSKSVLSPCSLLEWLGLMVDFDLRRFMVPDKKVLSIQALVADVLSRPLVGFHTLERLVGKCGSLYLAAPGAHMKLRQCYATMGMHSRNASPMVVISPGIRQELLEWLNIRSWCGGSASWASPHHFTIVINEPPSAGVLRAEFSSPSCNGIAPFSLMDSTTAPPARSPSIDAVGDAVVSALEACFALGQPWACFVDVLVGAGWRPSSIFSRDLSLSVGGGARADRLLRLMANLSIVALNVIRIPDPTPLAWFAVDKGSFVLRPNLWEVVETAFGPHDVDAMASDANAQPSSSGRPLPHYTRWPSANSGGVNVFSQSLLGLNVYCNAVFSLISPLISHFREQRAAVSLVAPGWYGSLPGAPWWPHLVGLSSDRLLLARAGTPAVFSNLCSDGSWRPAGPVPWDVWVFRLDFSAPAMTITPLPAPPTRSMPRAALPLPPPPSLR